MVTGTCNLSRTREHTWDSCFQNAAKSKPPVGTYSFLEARSVINNTKPQRRSGPLCSWGLVLNGLGADWILVDFQGHREGHVSCQAAAATGGHLTGVMLKPCALPRVSTPAPVLSLRLESANAFHQYWLCLK